MRCMFSMIFSVLFDVHMSQGCMLLSFGRPVATHAAKDSESVSTCYVMLNMQHFLRPTLQTQQHDVSILVVDGC